MTRLEYDNGGLIAQIPEIDGMYDTLVGQIGVTHLVDRDESRPSITLDCSEVPELQGTRGIQERTIHLNAEGRGSQQISNQERVIVDLERRVRPKIHMKPQTEYSTKLFGSGGTARTTWVPAREDWSR